MTTHTINQVRIARTAVKSKEFTDSNQAKRWCRLVEDKYRNSSLINNGDVFLFRAAAMAFISIEALNKDDTDRQTAYKILFSGGQ